MPGRMSEVPGQFMLAKHPACRSIDLGTGHTRADGLNSSLLRLQNSFIKPSSFLGRPADVHGTRAIRTITGEYNTKIADHEAAPGNARARCPAMDNRGARSGGEDRRK